MLEITYTQMFIFITLVWIALRAFIAFRNRKIDWKREALLITVYICFVVIARIVYFPWHLEDGHIGKLVFDADRIIPVWCNFIPFTFLRETYDGWKMNIIGNITMFIPVGVSWPLCFKKLDNVWKAALAGFGLSLFIELTQIPFFDRSSDIDDLILNTAGALIGACIYFLIKKAKNK